MPINLTGVAPTLAQQLADEPFDATAPPALGTYPPVIPFKGTDEELKESGFDKFISNLADPTGNSQFLLNLGAKLLAPRPEDESSAGFISRGLAESVGQLGKSRQGARKEAILTDNLKSGTEKNRAETAGLTRATASADSREDLLKARAEKLRADAKAALISTAKLPAAKVQEVNQMAKALRGTGGAYYAGPDGESRAVIDAQRIVSGGESAGLEWLAEAERGIRESLVIPAKEKQAAIIAVRNIYRTTVSQIGRPPADRAAESAAIVQQKQKAKVQQLQFYLDNPETMEAFIASKPPEEQEGVRNAIILGMRSAGILTSPVPAGTPFPPGVQQSPRPPVVGGNAPVRPFPGR